MRYAPLAALAFSIFSCSSPNNNNSTEPIANADGSKTVRSYYRNKQVKAEVTYMGDKRHGISRSYDAKGVLLLELPYADDKREGQSKKYYATGTLFQTTEYVDDMIHGKQVKYRTDGRMMSEAIFEKEEPCLGLKEYLEDNTVKKKYPKIVVKEIDRIESRGKFILEVSMSDKVKRVKYYTGKLSPGGCIWNGSASVPADEDPRVGTIVYTLYPGQFVMEEVTITAVVETLMGNSYVTQTRKNIAIKN
jgi:hypothetical protein